MVNNNLNFIIEDNIPIPVKTISIKTKSIRKLREETIIATLNKLAINQSIMINRFNDLKDYQANLRLIKKCIKSLIEICKKNGNEVDYLIKIIQDDNKIFIGYRIWRII